ncbi:MAG TPA: YhdH/YhfP family quinone oxidoreductase [Oligoflexus sp.]|uniref:YhdH/YhfP family quinone oxidoreductase n=1 Tax=Oligoflexus sp. TaxID=1971216 RepID=UPI002D4C641B|nr:YhdH/YhfP family quinone oxidoreductase [Oligoflexus sp.]HYX39502.1 YhdH/YhfP family quinone oxidoreductase [Oligoflexus sp.]
MTFRALRVLKDGLNQSQLVNLEIDALAPGNVLIEAAWSSINYKDALAITGHGKILKKFPSNPGIDVAGVVKQSDDARYPVGMPVLVTGCGLGENQDGGLAQYVRVPAEWVIPLPGNVSPRDAMIYGTAGFTVGICLHRLLLNDQTPDKGPMVVTGASGGVGSLAVAMLAKLGFEVIAVSGKDAEKQRLLELGAARVMRPEQLELGQKPLENVRFGGAIDNVGGPLLEGLLRHVNLWGNVASVGLAGGHAFQATVMPFILRGVSVLGVSSTNCPRPLREQIWSKLASEWKPQSLDVFVSREIDLAEVPKAAAQMLDRQTTGRTLVRLR